MDFHPKDITNIKDLNKACDIEDAIFSRLSAVFLLQMASNCFLVCMCDLSSNLTAILLLVFQMSAIGKNA